MSETVWQAVDEAAEYLEVAAGRIDVGVILGSGLGEFADGLGDPVVKTYDEVPHFAVSTVAGHAGRYLRAVVEGLPVGVFQGRFHRYEGWSADQIVLPARVAYGLGARLLIVTNAAGSTRQTNPPGTLMLISDHINMLGINPLDGPNDDSRGPRFPSLNDAYSPKLRQLARQVGESLGIRLAEGVYLAAPGPSYETPAEVRMYAQLGADAVGMSTVPEAIAAAHLGMEVLGVSCLTNWAAGMTETPPHHEEVIETGRQAASQFAAVLNGVLEMIGRDSG